MNLREEYYSLRSAYRRAHRTHSFVHQLDVFFAGRELVGQWDPLFSRKGLEVNLWRKSGPEWGTIGKTLEGSFPTSPAFTRWLDFDSNQSSQ